MDRADDTGATDDAPARWFRAKAIGTVRRPSAAGEPDGFLDPAADSVIELRPEWAAGLAGIDGYSHLVVLFWLDRAERPRRLGPGDARPPEGNPAFPAVGLFATRSPRRPNPIGLACPRLVRREGSRLVVNGLDAWDGTPVLDLKGYSPRDELRPEATVPDWLERLWATHDAERAAEDAAGG